MIDHQIRLDRLIKSALGERPEAVAEGWGGLWNGQTAHTAPANTNTPVTNPTGSGGARKLSAVFSASAAAASSPFFNLVRFDPADLEPVHWVIPGLLMCSDATILAAQGGGAKTALSINLVVAIAAGRSHLGPLTINPRADEKPRRAAYISGEEGRERLALLAAGAAASLSLDQGERTSVARNLMLHDARASRWKIGKPRPGERETTAPEAHDAALAQLRGALLVEQPDVVVLDTAAALLAIPNENDNNTITDMLGRLTGLAAEVGCAMLILHHTPKMTRETAAAQRGEVTMARGGSAFVNAARVVLTITSPSASEAGAIVLAGLQPDRVRRMEHAKVNDTLPMTPVYFQTVSEQVQIKDGTTVEVRAVKFLAAPPAAGGTTSNAVRNLVMRTIDTGVLDEYGMRLPLSPRGGSRNNQRDAVAQVAKALRGSNSALTESHAETVARDVLRELQNRIGCVVEEEVSIPKYKKDGTRDGVRKAKGLSTRWGLAPWASQPAGSSDEADGPGPDDEGPERAGGAAADLPVDAPDGPAQPVTAPCATEPPQHV
jgi:hypothetical protein